MPREIRSDAATHTLKTSLLVALVPDPHNPNTMLRAFLPPKAGVANPDPDDPQHGDWDLSHPYPAPTLRVQPGDTIDVTLYNRLDPVPNVGQCDTYPAATTPTGAHGTPGPIDQFPDCFHEDNVVNIHYHGLHVSQESHADNAFLMLYPKGQQGVVVHEGYVHIGEFRYQFQVPPSHPGGTFWYHPHHHGSSALQSENGLAGVLIVEDRLAEDPVFTQNPLQDCVMVIQGIASGLGMLQGATSSGDTRCINGQRGTSPSEMRIRVNEVQRWRILNASGHEQSAFTIACDPDSVAIHPIAADGYFLPDTRWQRSKQTAARWFFLAPGNRLDLLVVGLKATPPTPVPARPPGPLPGGAPPSTATLAPTAPASPKPLVTVTVLPSDLPAAVLPAALPAFGRDQQPIPDAEIVARHTLTFVTLAGGQGQAPKYAMQLDDDTDPAHVLFNPEYVNECVQVNTAEEWTIVNKTDMPHPFHIHLNPFFITDYQDPTGVPPTDPASAMYYNNPVNLWQDTLYIPPPRIAQDGSIAAAGMVKIRHRFPDITGTFMQHCHILGHEDRGFMHIVQVHVAGATCSPPPSSM